MAKCLNITLLIAYMTNYTCVELSAFFFENIHFPSSFVCVCTCCTVDLKLGRQKEPHTES